jgi:hypothetical protein
MKQLIFLWLVIFSFSTVARAQEKKNHSRWFIKGGFGYTGCLNAIEDNDLYESLSGFSKQTFDVTLISTSFFFGEKKKWGVDLSLHISSRMGGKNFDNYAADVYSDMYYPKNSYSYRINDGIVRFGAGVCYKLEKKRFILIPKALIGVTSFTNDDTSAELKRKDSNEMYQVKYAANGNNNSFTVMPCISLGYRFNRVLILTFDAMYSLYKTGFAYTETITNIYTRQQEMKTHKSNSPVNNLGFSIGLTVAAL